MEGAAGRGERSWPGDVGVFLVSAAAICLEIALTRIFSFVLWYHFAFLVISVALLGFGASGVVVSLSSRLRAALAHEVAGAAALGFAVTTLAALCFVALVPIDPAGIGRAWGASLALAAAFLVWAAPFFCAGVAIVAILSSRPAQFHRVYFIDLLGGCAGCLLLLGAIGPLGAERIVIIAALLASVAALALYYRRPRPRAAAIAVTLALGLLLPPVRSLLPVSPSPGSDPARSKALTTWLDRRRFPTARRTSSEWNAYSRVDVVEDAGPVSWLQNPLFPGARPPTTQIVIDGDAATSIVRYRGDPQDLEFLDKIPSALPYEVLRPNSALVIGAGGGVDIWDAVAHSVGRVDAVEINPLIVKLMRGPYAAYSGNIFERPGVRLFTAEGRHFVRNTAARYDLIQISLIDTWAALSSGAYSLSENYLYTVEAFQDYLRRLSPAGAIAVTRWLWSPPRESLRLCSVGVEALRREGAADPARHVVVVAFRNLATVVIKREPFTGAEVARFELEGIRRGFSLLYDPFHVRTGPFQDFFSAADRASFMREYPYDVTPVTDDSPFFFLQHRWRDVSFGRPARPGTLVEEVPGKALLLGTFCVAAVLSAIVLLVPLALRRREDLRVAGGQRFLLGFFAVGLGFMMVEVMLMQKLSLFLGHPVYALSVVLCTILLFSGLGSLASPRVVRGSPARLAAAIVVLALAVPLGVAAADALFALLLGWSIAARVAVTVLALAPLGFLMGIPFPSGLGFAQRRAPGLIPWAWAINGFASVVSTALCVLASMEFGFSVTALLAAGCYLAAGALFFSAARLPAVRPGEP